MKFYVKVGEYESRTQTAKNIKTGEELTLSDRKKLFDEDYCTVYRWESSDGEVFEFSVMEYHCTLNVFLCDIQVAEEIIRENLRDFLRGVVGCDGLIKKLREKRAEI